MALPAAERSVPSALRALALDLVDSLPADGCTLSRVIGQLLIDLVGYARDGRRMTLGRGYLLPDYPLTQKVIDDRTTVALSLADPNVDPGEAALLRELDFEALLMLPLELDERPWGLVEIYRCDARAFTDAEIATATETISQYAELIHGLQRRAAA